MSRTTTIFELEERVQQCSFRLKPIDIGLMVVSRLNGNIMVRNLSHAEVRAMLVAIESYYKNIPETPTDEHDQK